MDKYTEYENMMLPNMLPAEEIAKRLVRAKDWLSGQKDCPDDLREILVAAIDAWASVLDGFEALRRGQGIPLEDVVREIEET